MNLEQAIAPEAPQIKATPIEMSKPYDSVPHLEKANMEITEGGIKFSLQSDFIRELQERYLTIMDKCIEAIENSSFSVVKSYIELLERFEYILVVWNKEPKDTKEM